MHISSLPSDYGIGVFDENCVYFAKFLAEMGFSYWQVLPFHPVDEANSPYCSESAFAGNLLFIDPQGLYDLGLATAEEVRENRYKGSPYTADYAFAREKRNALLRSCFSRLDSSLRKKIDDFDKKNPWLNDYAFYSAVKASRGGSPWNEWPEDFANHKKFMEKHRAEFEEEAYFTKFCQYIFFSQWEKIKKEVNQLGISIIGDMPIYLSLDSADVWAEPELFLIDEKKLKPQKVAGVPPDYFSEDGQLWGNPLYDWERMEKENFRWWLDRLSAAFTVFDAVRIDHFRAFASFWAVDASSSTAKEGEWLEGPGMRLFSKVFQKFPNPPVIAEDLGVFGSDVYALLEKTGFPGMKVIQFGFAPGADSSHLPHNTEKNAVAYVGTHDNNTLLGWLWEASESERRFALDYCGFEGENWGEGGYHSKSCRKIIEAVWRSAANTAIISFQDLCGFGSDARMNIPGIAEKNWRYRTTKETIENVDKEYYLHINQIFSRIN